MFKFKLEQLLRFRKREEDEKMRELAFISAEIVKIKEEISSIKKSREEHADKLNDVLATAGDVNSIRLYENYLSGCESNILEKLMKEQEIKGREDEKRNELIEFVRKRKSLELYKEKLKERFETERAKKEQAFSDEVASQLFFREAL